MNTITIEDVITKCPDRIEPIIAQFSNGTIQDGNLESRLFKTDSFRHQPEKYLVAKSSRLMYAGHCNADEYPCPGTKCKSRNFLCILDEETDTMKLVECSTVVLHPVIKQKNPLNKGASTLKEGREEIRRRFVEEFGSKRSKKRLKESHENKVDPEKMRGVLTNALEKVTPIDEEKELNSGGVLDNVIPPCNRTAATIAEVYKLNTIIDDSYLLLFLDMTEETYQAEHFKSFSGLLKLSLCSSKLIVDEDERARANCAAFYTEYLVNVFKLSGKQRGVVKDIPNCPKLVVSQILKEFGVPGAKGMWTIKGSNSDKLLCYIVVLALLINGFEASLGTLISSTGVRRDKLEKIISCIGARLDQSGLIILKLPLVELKKARGKPNKKK